MSDQEFTCYLVERDDKGNVSAGVTRQPVTYLPPGDVLIRIRYSSLNYKDALAARGHRGVVSRFPHIPGIDAAGVVEESASPDFRPGDEVIVTGYDLGAAAWGGYSQLARVPAGWVVPCPDGLSLWEAMALGTAGFTAARSVEAVAELVPPSAGEVVVTGASGGVGSLAVALLAKAGYAVAASSGKPEAEPLLRELGAASVIPRSAVADDSNKPLLTQQWAAAVDTVGGNTLATLVRSVGHRGVVAACGLVGGTELPLTVYPFLLRGVRLDGIDSAQTPMPARLNVWRRLAGEWKLDFLKRIAREIPLAQLDQHVEEILAGRVTGRIVVALP